MEITQKQQNGATLVQIRGDLDLDSSPRLRTLLRSLARRRQARIVVDLSKVDFMDSSGVATLVLALREARRGDGDLQISEASDRAADVIRLEGVAGLLRVDVAENRDE